MTIKFGIVAGCCYAIAVTSCRTPIWIIVILNIHRVSVLGERRTNESVFLARFHGRLSTTFQEFEFIVAISIVIHRIGFTPVSPSRAQFVSSTFFVRICIHFPDAILKPLRQMNKQKNGEEKWNWILLAVDASLNSFGFLLPRRWRLKYSTVATPFID